MYADRGTVNKVRVLGIDAGFAATGLVVVEGRRVLEWDVIRTERTPAKRGVRVADDDAERCATLAQRLDQAIRSWAPAGAVVELPTGGAQGARANRAMGMATGIIVSVLELRAIPAEWVTPQMVKKAAAGRRDAAKEHVKEAVRRRFEWASWPAYAWQEEHVADAAAAILAAEGGTLLRALERAAAIAG